MNLHCVTITGADDSISPKKLVELSIEFPFAEWGILLGSRGGVQRFPSGEWIAQLIEHVAIAHPHEVSLSLHVCGKLLRSILNAGDFPVSKAVEVGEFRRMQLNFHGEEAAENREIDRVIDNICAVQATTRMQEIIVQLDGRNDWILSALMHRGITASGLYDRSHGAGELPRNWPTAHPDWSQGYAGGLGPDNLAEQLPLIEEAAGDADVWIDMETRVRSDNDRQFDLAKVRRCLEIAKPFVREEFHG